MKGNVCDSGLLRPETASKPAVAKGLRRPLEQLLKSSGVYIFVADKLEGEFIDDIEAA